MSSGTMRTRPCISCVRHCFLSEIRRWILETSLENMFKIIDLLFRFVFFPSDDPELFHGLPIGLQLVGRTLEEEAVIAMTEIVDRALKNFKE